MKVLITKNNNLVCDVCGMIILKDDKYVKQVVRWRYEGKKEVYTGTAHEACDRWQARQ